STLNLHCRPQGNHLLVTARDRNDPGEKDLAQLLTGSIYLVGPEIQIDQALNTAAVEGSGAMMMESNNGLAGGKLEKPTPLTVHWTKKMLFTGKSAEFFGEIQAEQENARMQCETLTVFFDRPISLREGNKADEKPARVQNLMCDRSVKIEEATYEKDPMTGQPKLVKYQRIDSIAFEMTALDREPGETKEANEVRASGGGPGVPGKVRLYQPGNADPLAAST